MIYSIGNNEIVVINSFCKNRYDFSDTRLLFAYYGVNTRYIPVSLDSLGGEAVDVGGFNAAIFYFDGAAARNPLCDSVQDAGVNTSDFLFAWDIGPGDRCEHKKIAFGSQIEQLAARLVEWREAFVRECYHLESFIECEARDFSLSFADAWAQENGAMLGRLKKSRALCLKFRCCDCRRRVFQYSAARVALICEKRARYLHLKYMRGFQKRLIADCGKAPVCGFNIAENSEKFRASALLP